MKKIRSALFVAVALILIIPLVIASVIIMFALSPIALIAAAVSRILNQTIIRKEKK